MGITFWSCPEGMQIDQNTRVDLDAKLKFKKHGR
jgi:hypothetical protein